jgi:ribosomal protein S18 acetylase RimI-like enzyme
VTSASAPASADFGPLSRRDLPALAALWNAALGSHHPLTERALERWWASSDTDPAVTFAARVHGELQGALLARAPQRAWLDPDLGFVSLLVVERAARGRGIGGALWDAALAALRARGRARIRLGADPDHLLPGVPAVADERTWRFLLRRGVAPGALEADLLVDLRAAPVTLSPAPGLRLIDDEPERVVALVRRCFPGRWADEVAHYAEAGVALLLLEEAGTPAAFAAAFRVDDAVLGSSLIWSAALPGPVGGLGPLGVDPALRGRGLGLRVVAEGLAWHGRLGARDVVIDWTSLGAFYGRVGARVWRVYQRAEAASLRPS